LFFRVWKKLIELVRERVAGCGVYIEEGKVEGTTSEVK